MMELEFRYQIDGLSLVFIYNLGVDLSGLDIGVAEELGYCITEIPAHL